MLPELVPDPEFDDPAAWSFVGFGATITGGQLRFVNANIASSATIPAIVPAVGEIYTFDVDVERAPVSPFKTRILFGGVELYNNDGTGNFTGKIAAINNSGLIFQALFAGQWFLDRVSIMADSIREKIIQSLAAQLATITTANGYDINVITVARAQSVFADYELPAISIFDGNEQPEPNYNFDARTMDVQVDIHGDAGVENRSVYANKLLASLKKAGISGDNTHGGNAERTSITATVINFPPDDDVTEMSVSVTFSILFEEITGDPYSTP